MRTRIKEIIERNYPETDELSIEGAVEEIVEVHEEEVDEKVNEALMGENL